MVNSTLFGLMTVVTLFSSLAYIIFLVTGSPSLKKTSFVLTFLAFLLGFSGLVARWIESHRMGIGHLPLSNLFESLVFFAWCTLGIYLYIEKRYDLRGLGAIVLPVVFLTLAYASLGTNTEIEPLVPALQSNWLLVHVLTCFLGYAAFAVSFGSSVMYLAKVKWNPGFLPDADLLDKITYKSVMIGFPFLTLGIVTGAAWAHYAWGSYWSWDPKETWSLITWLIYASFLHARFTRGWRGKRVAVLSIIGFCAVIFTYLGVNLLLSGLHSYATG